MRSWTPYLDYLTAIREQVCTHCPERVSDQFPFAPACWQCGVEVQLPELVDAVHEAGDRLVEIDSLSHRPTVCAQCPNWADERCPCPVRSLSPLLVQAVKGVDVRRAQHALIRRFLSRQPKQQRVPIREMVQAYEEATGTCVCAD